MHHTRSTGSGKEEAWSTQGKEEASLGQEVTLRVVPLFLLVLPFMGAEHTAAIDYLAKTFATPFIVVASGPKRARSGSQERGASVLENRDSSLKQCC